MAAKLPLLAGVLSANQYHATMKHAGIVTICMAGCLVLGAGARAVTSDPSANPYQSIVDRNVFSLKPPPPPPDPEANKPPPVKITLTGITTILGNKRALMKTPAPPGKPGEPAKPEMSYILTVGQREGEIEVLDIDEVGGNVKVRNGNIEVTLNIDKDGPKLAATPLPAGLPPGAAVPGRPIPPVPGAAPGVTPPTPTSNPGFTMPTRTLRLPPGGAGAPNANAGSMVPPGANVSGYSLGTTPGVSSTTPQKTWPPENTMSPEEQAAMIELQRQHLLQQGDRTAALMPGGFSPGGPPTPQKAQ